MKKLTHEELTKALNEYEAAEEKGSLALWALKWGRKLVGHNLVDIHEEK